MTTESWHEIDEFISSSLLGEDEALTHALESSAAAGLPAINVTPAQGKFLHLLARLQCRQIQRTNEGVRPLEVDVERVVLTVLDKAVIVAVLSYREFQSLLDARPDTFQEIAVT